MLSAIVIATIGGTGLGFQPVMVSALIEAGDFDANAAGYTASAEVFGIATTNLAAVILGNRFNWRALCLVGLFLMIAGGGGSLLAGTDVGTMLAARFISGLGAGLLISRGYAAAGLTRNPDRMLGYLLAASTAHVALGSMLLPSLSALWGMQAIFIAFGLMTLAGLPFVRWMPARADAVIGQYHSGSRLNERVAALLAVGLLFTGLGVLWPYLFQIGLSMGTDADEASVGLTISHIAAFGGALLAAQAGRLMSAFAMSVLAMAVTLGSILLLPVLSGGLAYALLASGFNGASNTAIVLTLGAVAAADVDGRWIAAAVALQTIGLAFGPALAARIMSEQNFLLPELLSAALIAVSCAAAIVAAYQARHRSTPART